MGHRVLSPELVARAGELAALGLPLLSIARGCGVSESMLHTWLRRARAGQKVATSKGTRYLCRSTSDAKIQKHDHCFAAGAVKP